MQIHKEKTKPDGSGGYNSHGVECGLLPNSPEGDAYTYWFKHGNMDELKEFVILLGTDIQKIFDNVRKFGGAAYGEIRRKILLKDSELIEQLEKEGKSDKKFTEKEQKEKFETYKMFKKEEYFGGIFIRIGVAFSEEAPIPYTFKRYRGTRFAPGVETSKSFRGGVICLSEKAEERADYKLISRLKGEEIEVSPVIKECYMEKGERKFRDLFDDDGNEIQTSNVLKELNENKVTEPSVQRGGSLRRGSNVGFNGTINAFNALEPEFDVDDVVRERRKEILTAVEKELRKKTNNPDPVRGFCVFVEYERALKDKQVMKSPHLKKLIEQEYIDVHVKANKVVEKFLKDNNKDFRGGLVKQKRDSTSMFVIIDREKEDGKPPNKPVRTLTAPATELYEKFSKLVSSLPFGSCVGFAYGDMKEIRMDRDGEGSFTDYFEVCVNLAARMAMRDWSYSTNWGMVGKNEHHNRVAFTSKYSDTDRREVVDYVEERLKLLNVPFTYDNVPLSALNAGDDTTLECISTQFVGWERLRVGDKVKEGTTKNAKGAPRYEITEDRGDFFKLKGKKKLFAREELTKMHEKPFDKDEFEKFKQKLKL